MRELTLHDVREMIDKIAYKAGWSIDAIDDHGFGRPSVIISTRFIDQRVSNRTVVPSYLEQDDFYRWLLSGLREMENSICLMAFRNRATDTPLFDPKTGMLDRDAQPE